MAGRLRRILFKIAMIVLGLSDSCRALHRLDSSATTVNLGSNISVHVTAAMQRTAL
jgi:hypothetical protein